ncbi:MAG TPA: rhodanese-like domain-containing protein [Solirubrobacterales bacterium]|nr:rhodanese-like domain-containing protein [Solirubrobacterales bacterium]
MAPETPEGPLSPEDARVLIGSGDADVVDIRDDADAFAEGHLTGAVHAPGGDSESLPDDLSDDKTLVFVCESGERSAEVAAKLRDEGRKATSVDGGMKSWKSSGMPVQPRDEVEFEGPDLKAPGT